MKANDKPIYDAIKKDCAALEQHLQEKIYVSQVTTPCWIWLGAEASNGYGRVSVMKNSKLAHRVMYILHKGPIPESLVLDHKCKNKLCVNPDHLEPMTSRENSLASGSQHNGTNLYRVKKKGRPKSKQPTPRKAA